MVSCAVLQDWSTHQSCVMVRQPPLLLSMNITSILKSTSRIIERGSVVRHGRVWHTRYVRYMCADARIGGPAIHGAAEPRSRTFAEQPIREKYRLRLIDSTWMGARYAHHTHFCCQTITLRIVGMTTNNVVVICSEGQASVVFSFECTPLSLCHFRCHRHLLLLIGFAEFILSQSSYVAASSFASAEQKRIHVLYTADRRVNNVVKACVVPIIEHRNF